MSVAWALIALACLVAAFVVPGVGNHLCFGCAAAIAAYYAGRGE